MAEVGDRYARLISERMHVQGVDARSGCLLLVVCAACTGKKRPAMPAAAFMHDGEFDAVSCDLLGTGRNTAIFASTCSQSRVSMPKSSLTKRIRCM